MPEIHFILRWPDGSKTVNYSPSSIVETHFAPGAAYPLAEFRSRAGAAMQAASARVRQVHGFPCARAQSTLDAIEAQAARFADQPGATVTLLEFCR